MFKLNVRTRYLEKHQISSIKELFYSLISNSKDHQHYSYNY